MGVSKSIFSQLRFSPSAAFSNPYEKAQPTVQPSNLSPTVTTSTDNRFGLLLQIRPLDEFSRIFKSDSKKKQDSEQETRDQDAKAGSQLEEFAWSLIRCRYK